MDNRLEIETEKTTLTLLDETQADLMLSYYSENKAHFMHWEPKRDNEFYTLETFQVMLSENERLFEDGSAIKLAVMNKNKTKVIGVCNFTNIIRGVFQGCNLGYSIDKQYQGKGVMYEALDAAIRYVFKQLGLHRVMANYVCENDRSSAVLKKLGFEQEGIAKSYLKINGRWRDHVLTAKVNSND